MKRMLAVILTLALLPTLSVAEVDSLSLYHAIFSSYLSTYGLPALQMRQGETTVVYVGDSCRIVFAFDGERYTSALLTYLRPLDYDFVGYAYCMTRIVSSDLEEPLMMALVNFHGGEGKAWFTADRKGCAYVSLSDDGYPTVYVNVDWEAD